MCQIRFILSNTVVTFSHINSVQRTEADYSDYNPFVNRETEMTVEVVILISLQCFYQPWIQTKKGSRRSLTKSKLFCAML